MRPRQRSTHRTMKPADGRHGQRVRGQGRGKMLVATSVQRHMNNNYLLIYNHVIIILFGPFNYHKRRESRQKMAKTTRNSKTQKDGQNVFGLSKDGQHNSTENYGRRCLTPLSLHRNYILS